MNAKSLIALAALSTAAFGALADDITPDHFAQYPSNLSRAEVKAQTAQAARSHQLIAAGERSFGVTAEPSTLVRASVKAEVLAARAEDSLIPAGELLAAEHAVPRRLDVQRAAVASR